MHVRWPSKKRIAWILAAIALMLSSAWSLLQYLSVVGDISGWIGLPQYADQIPRLEAKGTRDLWLGILLPLVAAVLLGLGKDEPETNPGRAAGDRRTVLTYSHDSREPVAAVVVVMIRLGISVLGTLGLVALLLFIEFVLSKLGASGV
jgi:hypothetical protein